MAYDLLFVPAISCEIERVFSVTKHLIAPHMARLEDEMIEVRECLCYWVKAGLVELQTA